MMTNNIKVQKLSSTIINNVIRLVKCYHDIKSDVPSEFLEDNLILFIQEEEDVPIVDQLFLSIMKHEKFLEKFVQELYNKSKRIVQTDKYILVVLTYVIVFFTNEQHMSAIAQLLFTTSAKKVMQLISFLGTESGLLLLTKAALSYFDQEYVKDVIIKEALNNNDIYKRLREAMIKCKHSIEPPKKRFTKPQHVKVLTHIRKVPRAPFNSVNTQFNQIKARPVPVTTYMKPRSSRSCRYKQHQPSTPKSISDSLKVSSSLLEQQKKSETSDRTPPPPATLPAVKASPKPVFKEPSVAIKPTATTVLRQAARIVKEEEEEIKRVRNLAVGALDYTQFERLCEELRNKEAQDYIQSIEKKHLKGLLTYEEAILAKRNLLEDNKKKRTLFEKQRQEFEKQMVEYKLQEEEKIRQIMQKTQEMHRSVYEKKKNLLKKKQKNAQEISEESRVLMMKVFREKTEELNRKMMLIRELKTLNSLMPSKQKKFDDTETMNIGLFCEMSIAELNERLVMVQAEMKEELEERQRRIKQEKYKQQELIRQMQRLIEVNNFEKKCKNRATEKSISKNVAFVQSDAEITNLRKQLEEKRMKRKTGKI